MSLLAARLLSAHAWVKKFPSYERLQTFARDTTDPELLGKVEIVNRYMHELPGILKMIKEKSTDDLHAAGKNQHLKSLNIILQ